VTLQCLVLTNGDPTTGSVSVLMVLASQSCITFAGAVVFAAAVPAFAMPIPISGVGGLSSVTPFPWVRPLVGLMPARFHPSSEIDNLLSSLTEDTAHRLEALLAVLLVIVLKL